MQSIEWHSEVVRVADLKDFEANPRRITKTEFEKLVKSIKEDGYHQRIVANQDNKIIGGHQRKKALLAAGYMPHDKIEILKPSRDLSDDEFRRINIRDNLFNGEFDFDILANEFEIQKLVDWGMNPDLLPKIEHIDPIEASEDDIPEVSNSEPVTKRGDVWALGNHRLMCGDSTSTCDMDKLLESDKPEFIYADPPYGINVNMNMKKGDKVQFIRGYAAKTRNNYENIIGDESTDVARDCYNLLVSMFDCPLVYWGANYFTDFLPPSKCWVTWYKKEGIKENTFCGAELAYTNANKHSIVLPVLWNGMYRGGESSDPRVHPTQKPIKLALEVFNYLEAGHIVYDPFGGSGTTLIACEKSDRKCLMMELAPNYCDVIIKRWEQLTGEKAELLT